jgi:uncharacterized damage-inducible protein DinB
MTIKDTLLTQFDTELGFTRRTLERVPMDLADWKPHDKSMTLGWLATFIALAWSWGNRMVEEREYEPKPGDTKPELPKTTGELLALFDRMTSSFRASLVATNDDALQETWTLKMKDKPAMTEPRWLMLQAFMFNHVIHHRGQLTVYLRLNGIAVPAIYSDSADEKGGMFAD